MKRQDAHRPQVTDVEKGRERTPSTACYFCDPLIEPLRLRMPPDPKILLAVGMTHPKWLVELNAALRQKTFSVT